MASTIIIYQGDGNTTSFTIPFDYLKKTFVKVFLDISTELKGGSSSDATADYYFKDATTIQLTKIVPTSTQTITIRRYTSATERVASFRDGSVLYAKDLDTSQVQAFHIAEEGRDILNDSLTVDRNGNWDAKNKRITRVGNPVEATDAVNKQYVDSVVDMQKTLSEYEATTKGYRDESEGFRDESLNYATQAQSSASAVAAAREEVLNKADEVSQNATEVSTKHADVVVKHTDVVAKAKQVSDDATQVSQDRAAVEEISDLLNPIVPHTNEVVIVAENIEHVVTDSQNINQINIVGTDLNGSLSDSTYDDYGTIGDTTPLPTITGGNIKIVADNIDNVNTVAGLAPEFETVVNSVATVKAYAESAQNSATDSQTYATTAGAKASEASTEASNAHNSATASASSAAVSRNWAIKLDAPVEGTDYSSKYYAQKAQESSVTATTKASEASESAQSASTSASTATVQATNASTSAESAENSATNSLAYAELSKQWAIQTDTPVEGSLYGAKFYAEQAASGQFQANWIETDETSKAFILNKPTKVSAFENDKGYLTEHQSLAGYATETFVNTAVSNSENKAYNDYGTLG